MAIKDDALIVAGVGLGLVVIAWYIKSKATDAIAAVPQVVEHVWEAAKSTAQQAGNAVNPVANDNIFYRANTGAYQWMTGSTGTIGTDLYDATHDGTLNPASTNNVIYRNIGGEDWSLGTKIYDWFH